VAALGEQLEEAEGDLPVPAGDEDFHAGCHTRDAGSTTV
jgi:hypothetical protein